MPTPNGWANVASASLNTLEEELVVPAANVRSARAWRSFKRPKFAPPRSGRRRVAEAAHGGEGARPRVGRWLGAGWRCSAGRRAWHWQVHLDASSGVGCGCFGAKVLYISGEESAEQVRMRANRLRAIAPSVLIYPGGFQ